MKILYFGDCTLGAMGIINRDIKRIIDAKYPEIQFDLLDWGITDNYHKFYSQQHWKNYDIIIIDPSLAKVCDSGWYFPLEDQALFKSKLIPVYHCELDVLVDSGFNHGWYEGWFTTPVCGINPYIVNQIKERGADSQMLPIGVNMDKFKPFKEVKKIKKIGFVGNGFQEGQEGWKSIKRPDIFKEIGEMADLEYVTIFGKPNGPKMYEDVDIVICTSTAEGLPTYFAEAAACKIPFISTNVGIVREYSKVKTFKTTEQAVEILKQLNESEDNIKEYVNDLYGEMFPDRNWENILEKYWVPYFKNLLNYKQHNR